MNDILKYFYHKWFNYTDKWHPFLSVYYLTYACDFRCPYCSDGSKRPYYALPAEVLPGKSVISLIEKIRSHCDYLVITGGEPLNHPDFEYIMQRIGKLRFKQIVLTTNGYDLDIYLSVITANIHSLVISLDALDHTKADAWYGIGKGSLKKIISNINLAANQPGRKYEMLISSVVTPENINDLYDVYHFAKQNNCTFAACPQLVGVKAHASLTDNPDYKQFYDFLIAEKQKGGPVYGSLLYLEYMKNFNKFTCYPFTMLVVSPTGDVFYPCLEIGNLAENLLENNYLHQIRLNAKNKFGSQPDCGRQCHSACALGFSLILTYPFSIFNELYLMLKQKLKTLS
ncbi:MAG: radical SAM protein [Proteobacteria bacterium]|nr:radical SAM protein [Pseudomonadota bacterium]